MEVTEGASDGEEDGDDDDDDGDEEGEGDLYNTDNEPYRKTLSDVASIMDYSQLIKPQLLSEIDINNMTIYISELLHCNKIP